MNNKKLIEETFKLIEERFELMKCKINENSEPLFASDFPMAGKSWDGYTITILLDDYDRIEFEFIIDLFRTVVIVTTYSSLRGDGESIREFEKVGNFFKYKKIWKEIKMWTDKLYRMKEMENERKAQVTLENLINKYKG